MNARRYAGLHNYLPGTTIAWEAYTKNHIKALGMALGILHAQLREYSGNLPSVCEIYSTILDRMDHYFQGSGVQQAMFSKLGLTIGSETCARLASLLRFCDGLSDQQALHMDFVRGNILFASASKTTSLLKVDDIAITGILDFEKVAYGHPAFDIARTLAFLLVDCKYKPADKVRKYFLHSGYAKRGGATLPATDLLEQLTDLFLLHDFYKFLRHNPYESLSENEHYSRTVQLLITRGLIESETEMVK